MRVGFQVKPQKLDKSKVIGHCLRKSQSHQSAKLVPAGYRSGYCVIIILRTISGHLSNYQRLDRALLCWKLKLYSTAESNLL